MSQPFIEYKNLNLLNVKYGFCWVRRDKNGVISGSTHPIGNLLEDIDGEVGALKERIDKLESLLEEKNI
jgi:hypothetical protein